MPTFSPFRAGLVLLTICGALVGMTGRVAYLQTYGRQQTIRAAERQQHVTRVIQARRGTIFDRNGLPMAATLQTLTLYVDPRFMLAQYQREGRNLNQMDQDLARLCRLLDLDVDQLLDLIARKPESRYEKVAEDLTERMAAEVEKLDIPGVGLEPVTRRYYPMGPVASHVLGAVGAEGVGLEGIEKAYQKVLAGEKGLRRVAKDARGRAIGLAEGDLVPPLHGRHLMLTIDANIQMMAEEELTAVCTRYQARSGEAVVMDPRTGEVLAMANYPTFNPQDVGTSRPEDRLNRCIVVPYEPGSTLKPFIVGPALAAGVTQLGEIWPIHGHFNPYGSRMVRDVHYYGPLATWDVLVKSSNVGMTMIALRMGNPRLHAALSSFGFGRPTGIELPGEDQGLLRPLNKWRHPSTVSVAQGYEMMVTPLQLARAFCTYANGGKLVRPRVVKGVLDAQGRLPQEAPGDLAGQPQVLSPRAAAQVRQALSDVVIRGTAQGKGSKVWNIVGKTGTAHIARNGSYAANLYNSSFLAAAPAEAPRIVVVLVVHEPDKSLGIGHYGGTVSAPPAIALIQRTLAYLQVPPSPKLSPPPIELHGALRMTPEVLRRYEQTGMAQ